MANFPTSLDALTNPVGGDPTLGGTVPHATQHATLNDIAELLEAKLGIGATTPSVINTLLGVDTAGVSVWRQLVAADILPAALMALLAPNPIINGGFQIWQRGTTFTAVANGAKTADRWVYGTGTTTAVHDILRSTDVPAIAALVPLTNYSLLIDCTTADAAMGATDSVTLQHYIEGYNWAPFAQKQFTVGFWIKATKIGVYCVSFHNSGFDRSYVAEITVNVTDTWEYKTVTVPASPSAGTWDYTTGIGLAVVLSLMAGSTYQTTPGTWQTGNFYGTANQVNACDSTANNVRIWGVTMGLGATVAPFWPRSFGQELALCLRYFERQSAALSNLRQFGVGDGDATNTLYVPFSYQVRKRALPTVTVGSPTNFAIIAAGVLSACTAIGAAAISEDSCRLDCSVAGVPFALGWAGRLVANTSTNPLIDISADL